ncbi:hypothetical protein SMALB_6166 [Streptomyces malaysiensis]|uniref:Uncharacterized protein n=1 Tax=Streptomyces malaysiensis TaxID=92644 RepID=A0A7X5X7J2_STRMQ|nr:hypothetical protein [Streptomyces malaysiensis]
MYPLLPLMCALCGIEGRCLRTPEFSRPGIFCGASGMPPLWRWAAVRRLLRRTSGRGHSTRAPRQPLTRTCRPWRGPVAGGASGRCWHRAASWLDVCGPLGEVPDRMGLGAADAVGGRPARRGDVRDIPVTSSYSHNRRIGRLSRFFRGHAPALT